MRILALSGSLREQSLNSAVARAAAELAPAGVDVEVFDRSRRGPALRRRPGRARRASRPASATSGSESRQPTRCCVVTPEYNGSVPGVLKNAIDWASRPPGGGAPLWGKTAAVAGATTGQYGALWAQQDLRRILGIAGARVDRGRAADRTRAERVRRGGRLRDPLVAERLRTHLEALVHEAAVPLAA